ncbi:MAG: crossover junction endodeoxyribonuclease RuvC [Coriobacteriales bacterium]|jgi:crossover junction endodeoxyribonuclease RuvC|nr:crossover junction endodeoxyribonuclease RuvC [Coriobacteriales bacterium]
MTTELRILGIDPGLAHAGWGVIAVQGSRIRPLAYVSIATVASEELPLRLARIYDELAAVILKYAPEELSIETIYHKGNPKSSVATAQARGVALVTAARRSLKVSEYAPAAIKQALVGSGSATKQQVQFMVRNVLGLDHTPEPDHAADALAAAICHAHHRRYNLVRDKKV